MFRHNLSLLTSARADRERRGGEHPKDRRAPRRRHWTSRKDRAAVSTDRGRSRRSPVGSERTGGAAAGVEPSRSEGAPATAARTSVGDGGALRAVRLAPRASRQGCCTRLVAHAKSVKEIVRVDPTVYPGIDYEKVEKNVKDAVAAYKPGWEALPARSESLETPAARVRSSGRGLSACRAAPYESRGPSSCKRSTRRGAFPTTGMKCLGASAQPLSRPRRPRCVPSVLATLDSEIELIGAPGVCLGTTIGDIVWSSTALPSRSSGSSKRSSATRGRTRTRRSPRRYRSACHRRARRSGSARGSREPRSKTRPKTTANHLGLLEGTRLAAMLGDLENGFGDKVERELRTALLGLSRTRRAGREYYSDAAEYEWELKRRKGPDRAFAGPASAISDAFLPRRQRCTPAQHTLRGHCERRRT